VRSRDSTRSVRPPSLVTFHICSSSAYSIQYRGDSIVYGVLEEMRGMVDAGKWHVVYVVYVRHVAYGIWHMAYGTPPLKTQSHSPLP
jgi:hypothetical protein